MFVVDPPLFSIESKANQLSTQENKSTAATLRPRAGQGSAGGHQGSEITPRRSSSSQPKHGKQSMSRAQAEGNKPSRQRSSVDSRRRGNFHRVSSQSPPSKADDGVSMSLGAAASGSEGEIRSAGSRQRRRPRAYSLGTAAEWPAAPLDGTDGGMSVGVYDVSSGGVYHDGGNRTQVEESPAYHFSGDRMEAVRSVFFTRPNLFREAQIRMRRSRKPGQKSGTAVQYLSSAGLLACMAALASTSLMAAPSFSSRPMRTAIAASYSSTFVWWDPGAGSLWLSLLAVALGLANKAGCGRGEDGSERWLSFCVSVSALTWLCLYCENRSLAGDTEGSKDDGRTDRSRFSSVPSHGVNGRTPWSVRAISGFAWRGVSALTVSPLFVALEVLVECGYRPRLLPGSTNEWSKAADSTDASTTEKGDIASNPSGAPVKPSAGAGSSSFPLALRETE